MQNNNFKIHPQYLAGFTNKIHA